VAKHLPAVLCGLALLSGCGGGGGGDTSGSPAAPAPTAVLAPSLEASVPAANPVSGLAQNVLPISVHPGPANTVNLAFASVTVCAPGSSTLCQTIDGVMIDTGSVGLRILAPALAAISLPQHTDAGGNPVVQCAQFADGFTWGPVKIADVRIAGERADSLPIQVIADPAFPSIPAGCAATGRPKQAVRALAANAILGVGAFQQDCGNACARSTSPGIYYVCPSSGCRTAAIPLAAQVSNPVARFAANNNGVVMQLPPVPAAGAPRVDGTLIFGIGTQDNNALGNALVFAMSSLTSGITTFYKGAVLDHSFVDSGSNAMFFQDASIPVCSSILSAGFYCAASPQDLSATIQGLNGSNTSITFSVANADSLFARGFAAFNNLGSPLFSSLGFDWGLPFFFGRRVFVAIEGTSVPGAPAGPFIAF
jgi:hypothetical protein